MESPGVKRRLIEIDYDVFLIGFLRQANTGSFRGLDSNGAICAYKISLDH